MQRYPRFYGQLKLLRKVSARKQNNQATLSTLLSSIWDTFLQCETSIIYTIVFRIIKGIDLTELSCLFCCKMKHNGKTDNLAILQKRKYNGEKKSFISSDGLTCKIT